MAFLIPAPAVEKDSLKLLNLAFSKKKKKKKAKLGDVLNIIVTIMCLR